MRARRAQRVQINNILWKSLSLEKTEGNHFFFHLSSHGLLAVQQHTHRSLTSALPLSSCFFCLQLWQSKVTLLWHQNTNTHTDQAASASSMCQAGIVQPFFPGKQAPVGCHCLKAILDHPLGNTGFLSSTCCRPPACWQAWHWHHRTVFGQCHLSIQTLFQLSCTHSWGICPNF